MASIQERSVSLDGQQPANLHQVPKAGINWNGPAGFWISLPLLFTVTIVVGLLLV